jgi:hypothetical protein
LSSTTARRTGIRWDIVTGTAVAVFQELYEHLWNQSKDFLILLTNGRHHDD